MAWAISAMSARCQARCQANCDRLTFAERKVLKEVLLDDRRGSRRIRLVVSLHLFRLPLISLLLCCFSLLLRCFSHAKRCRSAR